MHIYSCKAADEGRTQIMLDMDSSWGGRGAGSVICNAATAGPKPVRAPSERAGLPGNRATEFSSYSGGELKLRSPKQQR